MTLTLHVTSLRNFLKCIGIFSFRAFDRRLARLAAPISSGVRQGGQNLPPPPSGARSAEYPSGARVKHKAAHTQPTTSPTASRQTQQKARRLDVGPGAGSVGSNVTLLPMYVKLLFYSHKQLETRCTRIERDTGREGGTENIHIET